MKRDPAKRIPHDAEVGGRSADPASDRARVPKSTNANARLRASRARPGKRSWGGSSETHVPDVQSPESSVVPSPRRRSPRRRVQKESTMVGLVLKHSELDAVLDRLAERPENFEAEIQKLAVESDAKNVQLEIADPATWHKLGATTRVPREGARFSIETQLRSEVDAIEILDREAEARLARRIEFARARLNLALKQAGLTQEDLEGGVSGNPSAYVGDRTIHCTLPPKVCRRWAELHALRTEMVERNLYLALINVERYAHTSAGRLDLIQEGSAALFRAVDGFDWKRGLLFRTYAVHWLNQAFRSYLYNFNSTVRVPVYLQKALKHVNLAIERLRDPNASVEAIAHASGLEPSLVEHALEAARSTRSIDAPLSDEDDSNGLRDVLARGEHDPYRPEIEDISLQSGVLSALDRLSERERAIVSMRFGLRGEREHTLAEVAAKLGVSLERVRQIQVRAIGKMRTPQLKKAVEPFLN
jgi:RNA polymerase sigma factor (sigma-70 family)